MNKSAVVLTSKGVVAAAMLMAMMSPATSWADDHLLSVNGATVTQPATVTHAGTVTQPLILSNFDTPPAAVTLGQSQTLTVVSALVKMCKPGTNGALEWLDQGNTVVGVTGTLTSGTTSDVPVNGYRLTLSMNGISNTYGTASGPCSVSGQKTYTYTADASIDKKAGASSTFINKLTSTFNFWNATNGVPEPGTLLLMLAGLLVLGWMSMKGMRTVRRASA